LEQNGWNCCTGNFPQIGQGARRGVVGSDIAMI